MSVMAASTREGALLGGRRRELQQFAQRGCSGVVHGRAHRHLDGLQIQVPRLTATAKDDAQQLVYFACNFLLDRFSRFFSSGESTTGSDGRSGQICALTSISSLCRSCSFRNSAISRSAFRVADWSGRDSVTVLPLILKVRRRLGPWPGSLADGNGSWVCHIGQRWK